MQPASLAPSLLREARRRAGMTQRQLAERAGVQQPVISAYESGRRQPSVPMLQKLLEATGHRLDVGLERIRVRPDEQECARQLVQVLDLADVLPQQHRRTLTFPPLQRR